MYARVCVCVCEKEREIWNEMKKHVLTNQEFEMTLISTREKAWFKLEKFNGI